MRHDLVIECVKKEVGNGLQETRIGV